MDPRGVRSADGPVDEQILVLLQRRRRLSFFAMAESFPASGWRSLFTALNRLSRQEHVELMPLAGDYEILWQHRRERLRMKSEEPCPRM